jgi:hypothetical protein
LLLSGNFLGGFRMRFLFLVLVIFSISAQAAPVTWAVNNANFDDGGALTGQFDYDDVTDEYSNVSLNVSAGTLFDSAYYNLVFTGDATEAWFPESGYIPGPLTRTLVLEFSQALSSAGGSVDLMGTDGYPGDFETTPRVLLAGATLSAVPIPAAVWLFGSALAGLGWMRRKRAP